MADKAVKESEPGMLHHTFDQVAHVRTHSSLTSDIAAQSPEPSRQDPTDPLAFTWSEVYKDDASLLFHLTNPPLVKFVEQHGEMGGARSETLPTRSRDTSQRDTPRHKTHDCGAALRVGRCGHTAE